MTTLDQKLARLRQNRCPVHDLFLYRVEGIERWEYMGPTGARGRLFLVKCSKAACNIHGWAVGETAVPEGPTTLLPEYQYVLLGTEEWSEEDRKFLRSANVKPD